MLQFSKKPLSLWVSACVIGAASAQPALASDNAHNEDVIYITAEFQQTQINDAPVSAVIFDDAAIEAAKAQHLEDLFAQAANVNFSSGASRGRFIQIRGIGERSQFVEPINSSVGIIIDGMDFTGIGNAATTLDTQQVEILRGPQGTLLGANALAGMVNIVSKRPSHEASGYISAGLAEFNEIALSAAAGQSLTETLAARFAISALQSDGYYENTYLNRDDTQNIDERTLKAAFAWTPTEALDIQLNLLNFEGDNGYDAFNFENTYQTRSDEPGHDRQKSTGGALQVDFEINENLYLESTVSQVNSDLEYGYDEDWSNPEYCVNTDCPYGDYSSFDNYTRSNNHTAIDTRLNGISNAINWTLGIYHRDQSVTLERTYTYDDFFTSDFDTQNNAIYGQASTPLTDSLQLTGGLRLERREANYKDNLGITFSPEEDLWGGKLSLAKSVNNNLRVYGLISRGYKAGGFNANPDIPAGDRSFDTETMINYEVGTKYLSDDNRLSTQLALFKQERSDAQAKQSLVIERDDNSGAVDFNDYITNAANGYSVGLELDVNFKATPKLDLFAHLGLLDAAFGTFDSFAHSKANQDENNPVPYSLKDRDIAHAPNYQYAIGGSYQLEPYLSLSADLESKDAFYLSNSHDVKSTPYTRLNAAITYEKQGFSFSVYGKNVTNERVITRGFGNFGNDPANSYETEPYYQFDAPRQFGIKTQLSF